ncbi:outer membrane beta-barrel protein [Saccharicrinis aurantiacus]|uniref:outer membrane beta-barrel protein n=1 Tax=Saccharicrinis aurantiacus TaxID=1849719 RepID=UPI000950264B|nr:outer membrane beta-barrel protein [Saccharicrinis aurantiacus]
MKKSFLLLLAFVLTVNVMAQEFDSSRIRAGAGLVFATDIGNIGLTFDGVYEFTSEWEGSFSYSHIFKKDYVSFNIFDFDAHYVFYQHDENLNVYGIGGLGLTSAKVSVPSMNYGGFTTPAVSSSDTSLGLNIGIGANYKLSEQFNLAPEMKLTITDGTYFRIGAAVQYLF